MALANEDEWESDPELKEMRRDYIASFKDRRELIERVLSVLGAGHAGESRFDEALASVAHVAHKIAGSAESYGFATLTRLGTEFEDWVDDPTQDRAPAARLAAVLSAVLKRAEALGKDPATEFVGSLQLLAQKIKLK